MERDRGRMLIAAGALMLALLVVLLPPWKARAVRTTTRFSTMRDAAPATLVDTVSWTLASAPIFAPPRAALTGSEMRHLTERALAGDTTARAQLVPVLDAFERRVRAPDILRTSGELWRDSVLTAAGLPSISAYDVGFSIDDVGIATRLAALAVIALLLDNRRRHARPSPRPRGRDHRGRRASPH
jgi:hypothetical protein